MKVKTIGSPFGSITRTRVLLILKLLGASYQREIARLLETAPSVVQKALALALEIARLRPVDLDLIRDWSSREGKTAECGEFLRKVGAGARTPPARRRASARSQPAKRRRRQ